MKYIDLHVHSTKSDGSYTPTELVAEAIKQGLSCFALTDHDTISGIDEARAAAKGTALTIIPGIEFSTSYYGKDIHMLGLCLDYKNAAFQKQLNYFIESRDARNEKIYSLFKEHGIEISKESMKEMFGDVVYTRAHMARFLLNKGYTTSINGAFTHYIGDHGPCYVPRENITPKQTIESILDAGGIPIIAHPLLYKLSKENLENMVKEFKKMGMLGIEAIYWSHTPSDENALRLLAGKYDLIISGGSDFHGANRPNVALGKGKGNLKIPMSILDTIKSMSTCHTQLK